jgi:hypothetical protein
MREKILSHLFLLINRFRPLLVILLFRRMIQQRISDHFSVSHPQYPAWTVDRSNQVKTSEFRTSQAPHTCVSLLAPSCCLFCLSSLLVCGLISGFTVLFHGMKGGRGRILGVLGSSLNYPACKLHRGCRPRACILAIIGVLHS